VDETFRKDDRSISDLGLLPLSFKSVRYLAEVPRTDTFSFETNLGRKLTLGYTGEPLYRTMVEPVPRAEMMKAHMIHAVVVY
jgi:hypothetical protein